MHGTKGGINRKLLRITVIPLLVAGMIILCAAYITFSKTVQEEVHRGLKSVALTTLHAYDEIDPGDYFLISDENDYILYKGYHILSGKYDYLDDIKRDTDVDVSIFYFDINALTTIRDEDGTRLVDTVAHPKVVEEVFKQEEEQFYERVRVGNKDYFAYYTPIHNSDGECVGMIFAGKPTNIVKNDIINAVMPIMIIVIISTVFACFLCNEFSQELIMTIEREKTFLGEMAKGNLKAELDMRISRRSDELGEMGRFMIHVQKFLRDMVERDALTKLYSRRIGETKLKQVAENSKEVGTPFCVAICDIDFFKKFNDEYGHDCGDQVLKEIAEIFNHEMFKKGFAVRWGGEEFLLIYENRTLDQAEQELSQLREKIIAHELCYKEEILKITMTFGIVDGTENENVYQTIKEADKRLYRGKVSGRNQIVAD